MARNRTRLPSARLSSQLSMWTYPVSQVLNRLRFSVVSFAGRREMPWRWRQRCKALRLRFGMVSFRQPRTSFQWQQCLAPEYNDDRFLGRGQDRAFRLWPHGSVGRLDAAAPPGFEK